MTIEQYNYYTKREGIAQGIQLGLERGISQGIAQQKAEDERTISQQADEIEKLRTEIERLKSAAASYSC